MEDGVAPPSDVESIRAQIAALQIALKEKEDASEIAPYSKSFKRVLISTILDDPSEGLHLAGKTIRVGGWVKTGREAGAGAFAFLEVNDGTTFASLQVMLTKEVAGAEDLTLKAAVPTGTSVLIEGELAKTPEGTKQKVELKAAKIFHLGPCDNSAGHYPFAKKKQTLEFLREKAHLRPRTNTIGAVARVRNALAFATHEFFQKHGFVYVCTPLITCSDAEGAGELFQVTTLLSKVEENQKAVVPPAEVAEVRGAVEQQQQLVVDLKQKAAEDKKDKDVAKKVKQEGNKLIALEVELREKERRHRMLGGLPRREDGAIDYSEDFFGRQSFLTVSGQMQGEYYACALSNIYTFGPTFRAENSHTSRHLAEFWMIEPEMAFCDLADNMQTDLEFLQAHIDENVLKRLQHVAEKPFKRITYTEAVELLTTAIREKKKKFENNKVKWGDDLGSEHERYLAEEVFHQPTIVYNYPAEIKAFYMRMNSDGRTVAAMDVLVPGVGELIGGSQREERLQVLEVRLKHHGLKQEDYEPYLDLRRYGTIPHSGFGLGFERLVCFATGVENIRDVIPFPRWPGHAEF